MVVLVHGGPAAAHTSYWLDESSATELALLRKGYFVFLPNPRGSQGFGQTFTRANVKDFGYGDLRDIGSGVDRLVGTLPIDSTAIGITLKPATPRTDVGPIEREAPPAIQVEPLRSLEVRSGVLRKRDGRTLGSRGGRDETEPQCRDQRS